jgi:hypothetical protein
LSWEDSKLEIDFERYGVKTQKFIKTIREDWRTRSAGRYIK